MLFISRTHFKMLRAALVFGLLSNVVGYNYIPGIALKEYERGSPVGPIKVNSLFSHEELISLDFYSVKFCAPNKTTLVQGAKDEKLGEVIWGDRIAPSLYKAKMMVDQKCAPIRCSPGQNEVTGGDLARFERRIRHGYRGTFVLDNLPVVSNGSWVYNAACPTGKQTYDTHTRGFALGVPQSCIGTTTHIHNHLALHIHANQQDNGKWIIVGFYVVPHSIDHVHEDACDDNFKIHDKHPPVTTMETTKKIIWSYSVKWHESTVSWSNRWDAYLNLAFSNRNARVHWLGIVNSSLIILCFATVVAMIMIRALRLDIMGGDPDDMEEQNEEVGWKLVHGDVFRIPEYPRLLAVLVGTGLQLIGMASLVFTFAILGFLSPANRGGLITASILLFVLMSILNGYSTAYVLITFNMFAWRPIFAAALAFPGGMLLAWVITEVCLGFMYFSSCAEIKNKKTNKQTDCYRVNDTIVQQCASCIQFTLYVCFMDWCFVSFGHSRSKFR